MKKKLIAFILILCIAYGIFRPKMFASAAANGLYLWYHSVLPTLLPFGIISNIMFRTGLYDNVFDRISSVLKHIYPLRAPLFYPIIAGFLFGFPLGSKLCADLYHIGKISKKEAVIVSCISNNFGPAFLFNYVCHTLPGNLLPDWLFLMICYLSPLFIGRILITFSPKWPDEKSPEKIPPSRSELTLTIIDDGIMNGFTTMIKLAGYIMFFSIAADIITHLPISQSTLSCCVGFLEITNGIYILNESTLPVVQKWILAAAFVSFGGLSGLCQTASMLSELKTGLSVYVKFRLANMCVTILLTAVLVYCLNFR